MNRDMYAIRNARIDKPGRVFSIKEKSMEC